MKRMRQPAIAAAALLLLLHRLLKCGSDGSLVAADSSNRTGFSLRLIHRDSVHSVLRPGNLSHFELYTRLLRYTGGRTVRSVTPEVARPMVEHFNLMHYVKLHVGEQRRTQNLLIDTGSDLTWFQCSPCDPCFQQDLTKYFIGESRTFRYMPCNDPLCRLDEEQFSCDGQNHCVYNVHYEDSTSAAGVMGRETFFFEDSLGGESTATDIGFGCTTSCAAMFDGTTAMSGILGMGNSLLSLQDQVRHEIGHRFSHCFVPIQSDEFSYLRFGSDVPDTQGLQSTHLIPDNWFHTYFYVQLHGISFNGKWLPIPGDAFNIGQDGEGGVIIDTGSWYTMLVPPAYTVLRRAVIRFFSRYPVYRREVANSHLCFKKPSGQPFPEMPWMVLHFEGADMELSPEDVFFMFPSLNLFCMGISSMESSSMIGAMQLVNKRLVYDLDAMILSFTDEDCEAAG